MQLPHEMVMDNEKATRGLVFTPELAAVLPGLPQAFEQVNEAQNADREAYLNDIVGSIFSFRHRLGRVTCAALWNHAGENPTEALVTLPPFTDCAPNRSGSTFAKYADKENANLIDIIKGSPNSARQIIKLATSNELEHALGAGKVSIGFFSDMPMRVYSTGQRAAILGGDFADMTEIVEHGLAEVQDRLHGPKSETQITDIHLAGASQGANQVVAVGSHLADEGAYRPKSVTTQELIMGPKNYRELLKGLGVQVGEPSTIDTDNQQVIPEIELLHDLDRHGNEPAMLGRMFKASFLRPFNMAGLTKPTHTYLHIDNLDSNHNVPVTVVLAEQSGLTQETASYLKDCSGRVGIITVRAVAGQFADHLVDENVDVLATGIALGSRR